MNRPPIGPLPSPPSAPSAHGLPPPPTRMGGIPLPPIMAPKVAPVAMAGQGGGGGPAGLGGSNATMQSNAIINNSSNNSNTISRANAAAANHSSLFGDATNIKGSSSSGSPAFEITPRIVDTKRGKFSALQFGPAAAPASSPSSPSSPLKDASPLVIYIHGAGMSAHGFALCAASLFHQSLVDGGGGGQQGLAGVGVGGGGGGIQRGPSSPMSTSSAASKAVRGFAFDLRCHGQSTKAVGGVVHQESKDDDNANAEEGDASYDSPDDDNGDGANKGNTAESKRRHRGGGGDERGGGGGEASLSMECLVDDAIVVIQEALATWYPCVKAVYLVGHSLGGAIVSNMLQKEYAHTLGFNVAAAAILDVVEGTAKQSLIHMKTFLERRPSRFASPKDAVRWFLGAGGMKNAASAELSVPKLLVHKRVKTERRGGAEAPQSSSNSSGDQSTAPNNSSDHPTPSTTAAAEKEYVWRTDLMQTLPQWDGWFVDLDKKFLAIPCPKMLLLAGTDRLDKELTVGHMMGKFQLEVMGSVSHCGHYLHEDCPDIVAGKLLRLVRRVETLVARLPAINRHAKLEQARCEGQAGGPATTNATTASSLSSPSSPLAAVRSSEEEREGSKERLPHLARGMSSEANN